MEEEGGFGRKILGASETWDLMNGGVFLREDANAYNCSILGAGFTFPKK